MAPAWLADQSPVGAAASGCRWRAWTGAPALRSASARLGHPRAILRASRARDWFRHALAGMPDRQRAVQARDSQRNRPGISPGIRDCGRRREFLLADDAE